MKRTILPLLGGLLLLGACMDQPLPTALAPEGAAFDHVGASYQVTNTSDSGEGSLRYAIEHVEAGGTITFAAALDGQTIALETAAGATGDEAQSHLAITKGLTLDASALPAGVTLRGDGTRRVLVVAASHAAVRLRRLTITGGGGVQDGGGILAGNTPLTLEEVTVSGNVADDGVSGTADSGGGIYLQDGTLDLVRSAIHDNRATVGGGIYFIGGPRASLVNSTVSGNVATADGGGIFFDAPGGGSRVLEVVGSTVYGNTAPSSGQQIRTDGFGTVNTRLVGAVIGGSGTAAVADCSRGFRHTWTATASLARDASCDATVVADLGLEELADNGGPTLTHKLKSTSPALDAGVCSAEVAGASLTLTTDQRGVERPQGSACDIGAFELVQQAPPSPVGPVLAFFDQEVGAGRLVGSGPDASAQNRLSALRNMLVAASDLLVAGDLAGGCGQLLQAQRRTDGLPQPPDFAAGPSAPALAEQIQALRGTLGCP